MAEPTLLLDQLIITHNGGATEFSYTWTKATGTLTTAGFREYGSYFTWMHVTHTLIAAPTEEISAYVYVTETMDSNDIVAALLAYLEGAITSLTIETISETDASASVTLEMEMSFYDFRQKEPTVSVSSNGD